MSSALLCHVRYIPGSSALLTESLVTSYTGASALLSNAGSRRRHTTTITSRISPSRAAFLQRERGAYAGSSQANNTSLKLRTGYVKPRVHTPTIAPPKALPPPEEIRNATCDLLVQHAPAWSESLKTRKTLSSIGIPSSDIATVLQAFQEAVKSRTAIDPKYWDILRLQALWEDIASKDSSQVSLALTRVLFAFSSSPSASTSPIPATTLTRMQSLHSAADTSHPEERFERARRMRRSFIMHVGPTNSGKTHHALRALAAAESGVYAGPLRLLAHEIFTRLNAGQIVPAGIDVSTLPPYTEPDTETNFDVDEKAPVVRKDGDPRFVRPCNMITGEEQRIVDDRAPLLASTIEMLGHSRRVNVAVIDEIQLIGDAQRGGAWTDAVLGLCADEIHLCGEESAVPIVERLLADTGDKLEVRRYQRLTPLVVAEKSLNEDFSKIEKGDCVVGFSRSAIFKLKNRIEKATGLRCAMAYGALPPEIRSEQAALFNDPDSGYDVLVGTDAIGMGLNLKIKRIILESTVKFNGQKEEPLSISQIKQIAGRAGRFGLHGDSDAGGVCTTLREEDMPRLRAAIAAPQTVLSHARLSDATDRLTSVFESLPAGSPLSTVLKAYEHICAPRAPYRRTEDASKDDIVKMLDEFGRGFDMNELVHLLRAPIQARDPRIADGVAGFLRAYGADMRVHLRRALGPSGLLVHLKEVHETMRRDKYAEATMETMMPLESLHRLVTLYLWCAFRNPVIWADAEDALLLKNETEEAMTWALARMASEGGHRTMPAIRKGGKWAEKIGNRLSGSNGRHKRTL